VQHLEKMPCALGDKPCALAPATRASVVHPHRGTCSSASSRIALPGSATASATVARLEPNTRGTHRPAVADLRSAVSSGSCSARPGPASPLAVVRLRQPAPAAARGAAQAALCRRAGDAQLHERGSSRRARLAAGSRTARLKLTIETASSLLIFASARAAAALAAISHERPTNSYIQG
jgi:hypothetical protein